MNVGKITQLSDVPEQLEAPGTEGMFEHDPVEEWQTFPDPRKVQYVPKPFPPRLRSVTLGMGGKLSMPGYNSIEPSASLTWEVHGEASADELDEMKRSLAEVYRRVLVRDIALAEAMAAGPEAYAQALDDFTELA